MSEENKDKVEEKQEEKTVPYERFAEVVHKNQQMESELKKIQESIATEKKTKAEQELVAKGEYEKVIAQVKAERDMEREKSNALAKDTYLFALGLKHGVIKPEFVKLFDGQIEVENLEIKNADKVEEAFMKFKEQNAELFKKSDAKPTVPKTDNTKPNRPNTSDDSTLSEYEKMIEAVKYRMANPK